MDRAQREDARVGENHRDLGRESDQVELLEARVMAALERAGYVGRSGLLVVAVSGGPDSLALLHSLLRLREVTGLELHVAHLNHNFRDEAEEDARFVGDLAKDLGLPATVGKADPVKYQKEMGISSFENAAREVRYDFLGEVARERAAVAVALGHTADDLAETVIMHIIRGSGVYGLRGMEELSTTVGRRGGKEVVVFRPLLKVTKGETLDYCRRKGIAFREDPANRLMTFTRNRVRHRLLPSLESYNPRIREALVRLSNSASLEVDYLEEQLVKVWPTVVSEEGDSLVLDSRVLSSLHRLMQLMVLRRAYRELVGDTRRLEEVHLNGMADFIGSPPGRAMALPRGLRLHSGYDQLTLTRCGQMHCPFPPLDGRHQLTLSPSGDEGFTEISGWRIATCVPSHSAAASGGRFTACFDANAVRSGLWVRTRVPGDRFQPLGMDAEKKLQDFYVDEKVPRPWRDRIPLVVTERGIAWVVGYRVAEWARAGVDSKCACQVRFSPP